MQKLSFVGSIWTWTEQSVNSSCLEHEWISVNIGIERGIYYIIWVNFNDLTTTSLESWLVRGIIPKWPYFRLVNYYNLQYPDIINLYNSNIKPVTDLLVKTPLSQQVNATFQRKVRFSDPSFSDPSDGLVSPPLETQGIETQHYTFQWVIFDSCVLLYHWIYMDLLDSGYYTWVFFIIVSSYSWYSCKNYDLGALRIWGYQRIPNVWGLNALDWRDQALHCRGHNSQAGFHPM